MSSHSGSRLALSAGHQLGPYEILALLGAGGMGEVYKARDTRLDRIVAIKVLPESLAGDPQFRERFDREARTLSQLEHPHICALYDLGEASSADSERGVLAYLLMQYLEGDTLDARLTKGALPLDLALQIAISDRPKVHQSLGVRVDGVKLLNRYMDVADRLGGEAWDRSGPVVIDTDGKGT